MPNIKSKINNHSRNITQGSTPYYILYNCLKIKERNPINSLCLRKNMIYKANINCGTASYSNKIYIGMYESTFKKR